MVVSAIQIVRYGTPTGPWHGEMHRNPSSPEIESAIRSLDRCYLPFVFLYRRDSAHEDDIPDLQVVGGLGEYSIQAYQPDKRWLSYVDVERSGHDVDIWVSDHGTTMPKFLLCPDLERVLVAVRHFCETGTLNPDME